jgi:APA family basic amino acid/polyamine antiporter
MGNDGLLPAYFAKLHPKFNTPYQANLAIMVLVGLFAAFVPGNVVGHMSSIGTLFAFILVCLSVIILRKREPNLERQFRTPWVPVVPLLGIAFCSAMVYGLGWANWLRLFVWLILGFVVYFWYGKKHSKL